jgi:hypothetical protein
MLVLVLLALGTLAGVAIFAALERGLAAGALGAEDGEAFGERPPELLTLCCDRSADPAAIAAAVAADPARAGRLLAALSACAARLEDPRQGGPGAGFEGDGAFELTAGERATLAALRARLGGVA